MEYCNQRVYKPALSFILDKHQRLLTPVDSKPVSQTDKTRPHCELRKILKQGEMVGVRAEVKLPGVVSETVAIGTWGDFTWTVTDMLRCINNVQLYIFTYSRVVKEIRDLLAYDRYVFTKTPLLHVVCIYIGSPLAFRNLELCCMNHLVDIF